MKTLILALAATLIAMPAQATTWCPKTGWGINKATAELPANLVARLDASGLTLVFDTVSSRCESMAHVEGYFVEDFECVLPSGMAWGPTLELAANFTPPNEGKFGERGFDEVDPSSPEAANYELWLIPEYTVASELQFVPCPSDPAIM